jgi:hypothetical protein
MLDRGRMEGVPAIRFPIFLLTIDILTMDNGETMRKLISHKLISLLALGLLLSLGLAQAAEDKAKTPQQQKMATCNKAASGKKGDERKQFMSDCLSAKPEAPSAAGSAQQQKMKDCNKQADGMKGDDRKQFMSTCLKK